MDKREWGEQMSAEEESMSTNCTSFTYRSPHISHLKLSSTSLSFFLCVRTFTASYYNAITTKRLTLSLTLTLTLTQPNPNQILTLKHTFANVSNRQISLRDTNILHACFSCHYIPYTRTCTLCSKIYFTEILDFLIATIPTQLNIFIHIYYRHVLVGTM